MKNMRRGDHLDMDGDEYPYGLQIHLEDDELEKLGVKSTPKVGEEMEVMAKVRVTSSSEHSSGNKIRKSASLQITEMELDGKKSLANALYGSNK